MVMLHSCSHQSSRSFCSSAVLLRYSASHRMLTPCKQKDVIIFVYSYMSVIAFIAWKPICITRVSRWSSIKKINKTHLQGSKHSHNLYANCNKRTVKVNKIRREPPDTQRNVPEHSWDMVLNQIWKVSDEIYFELSEDFHSICPKEVSHIKRHSAILRNRCRARN